MNPQRGSLIYEGKAKRLYQVQGQEHWIWQEFKNSLTAFNAQKKGEFEGKGSLNRDITSLVFRYLRTKGIKSHWVQDLGVTDQITEKLTMLKVEVVVRNILAGSTAKKFAIEEGTPLEKPLLEFYYKEDGLGDPFISDDQALMMKVVAQQKELDEIKAIGYRVNEALKEFFAAVGIQLVDFKIEVGKNASGEILLADEITPDSCRLWDKKTNEKMDKDRFRRDLGNVKENYQKVYDLLKGYWEGRL